MAKTEFAQKLLDDLRMRKEKMGFTNRSASTAKDQRSIRGPREAVTCKSSSKNMVNADVAKTPFGTRHHKTSSYEGPSQEIIPVRNSHVDQPVDVSLALALALSNSGKLQNIEFFSKATVGKEHIMHRGSLNFGENYGSGMSSSVRHPTDQRFFSHLDINEVSKGVQQLNKILKACSNGLSFDKDAVNIGRELFKGAMDLEESLRMLVTLQEASDYMVSSKGKVRLLKGKEDESSSHEANKKKEMNRPRFSFDEPQRNSRSIDSSSNATSFLDKNKWALSFLKESNTLTSISKSSSKSSKQYISQKKSLSCDPGSMSDSQFHAVTNKNLHNKESVRFHNANDSFSRIEFVDQKAIPKSEKMRIPNVVAKLMGLEELPLPTAEVKNSNAERISVSKKVRDSGKKPIQDVKNIDSEVLQIPMTKKESVTGKTSVTITESKKEVDEISNSVIYFYPVDNRKNVFEEKDKMEAKSENTQEKKMKESDQNIRENPNSAIKNSLKPQLKTNKKQHNIANMHQSSETMTPTEHGERTREDTNIKKLRRERKFGYDTDDKSLPFKSQNNSASKHEFAPRKKDQLLRRKTKVREALTVPSNQSNAVESKLLQPQPEVPRLNFKHRVDESSTQKSQIIKPTVHENSTRKSQHEINKPHVTQEGKGNQKFTQKKSSEHSGTQMVLSDRSTPTCKTDRALKHNFEINHQEKRQTNNKATYHEEEQNKADANLQERGPSRTEVRAEKEKATSLLLDPAIKKSAKIPSTRKADNVHIIDYENKSNANSEEDPRRIETTLPHPLKDHTSFLHELEHRWKERIGNSEGNAVGSPEMNSQKHMQQKSMTTFIACNFPTRDCESVMMADQSLANETNNCGIVVKVPTAQLTPQVSFEETVKQHMVLKENLSEGLNDRMRPNNSTRLYNQEFHVDGRVSLTKNEQYLKQVLVSGQHFLNTAKVLFKLKIPVGVLQASENICPNEGNKIVVDCGYEIMRRKSKREEISSVRRFAPVKIRCLDDLVKELSDDLENLKLPGTIEGDDDITAECLHKLLEIDIQSKNPDVNCMWDFEWKSTTGDAERDVVIRDLEKHLFNGLINELARDLLTVAKIQGL